MANESLHAAFASSVHESIRYVLSLWKSNEQRPPLQVLRLRGRCQVPHHWSHAPCQCARSGTYALMLPVFINGEGRLRLSLTCISVRVGTSSPTSVGTSVRFFILFLPLSLLSWGILQVNTVLSVFSTLLSRKHEFQADAFACQLHYGEQLKEALCTVHTENKSTLDPDPWSVLSRAPKRHQHTS